jgi:hypothetical protein
MHVFGHYPSSQLIKTLVKHEISETGMCLLLQVFCWAQPMELGTMSGQSDLAQQNTSYISTLDVEYRWCETLLATEEHKTIPAYIELLCHCCNNATQYHPVPCRMLLMKASFLLLLFAVPPAECHGIAFIIVTINAKHKGGMQDHRNAKHHTSKNMICRAKY